MISEHLHRGLCVRVIGGLESDLGDADLLEEQADDADQMAQGQVTIGDQALHLMELAQVSSVHRFVSEHAIYTINIEK